MVVWSGGEWLEASGRLLSVARLVLRRVVLCMAKAVYHYRLLGRKQREGGGVMRFIVVLWYKSIMTNSVVLNVPVTIFVAIFKV